MDGQLHGESDTRTIEAVLARVENQVNYGEIHDDVIEVAAAYAVRRFHVGIASLTGTNARLCYSMLMFLRGHGFELEIDQTMLAKTMELAAAGEITDQDLWTVIFEHLRQSQPETE